jgi:uncharacterized protein (DUF849 family)
MVALGLRKVSFTMLQACLNGGRSRDFHPAVPLSPQEIADDAKAVVAAGAMELHIHPRDASGRENLDPDVIADALEAVRAAAPGVPVGVSTGWWIAPGGLARKEPMRRWRVKPDYVSVNLNEEDAPDVIRLALEKGIGVEAGLWTLADAERFLTLPEAPRCLRVLIEIQEKEIEAALRTAHDMLLLLDRAGVALPRLLHGSDATMWPLYAESRRLDLDARIGLEDGATLPSGEIAKNNAALIAAAREWGMQFLPLD